MWNAAMQGSSLETQCLGLSLGHITQAPLPDMYQCSRTPEGKQVFTVCTDVCTNTLGRFSSGKGGVPWNSHSQMPARANLLNWSFKGHQAFSVYSPIVEYQFIHSFILHLSSSVWAAVTKILWLGWLINSRDLLPIVLEAQSSKSGCQGGGDRGNCLLCFWVADCQLLVISLLGGCRGEASSLVALIREVIPVRRAPPHSHCIHGVVSGPSESNHKNNKYIYPGKHLIRNMMNANKEKRRLSG